MPKTTITNFDPARIPDTEEEASFHADATYVFSHLSAEIIPKFNQNLDWIDGALVGDTQTILNSLNAILNTQLVGGIGTVTTGGVADWNDATNARSGNGYTLMVGTAPNGPGVAGYHYPFSFEHGSKNGTGNLTQFAIPYNVSGGPYFRTRYGDVWSDWVKIWNNTNDGAGSGLDADLLDGQQGSYYLAASAYSAADVLAKLKTVDGSGSGVDADLLDGNQASHFATASALAALLNGWGGIRSQTASGYIDLGPQNTTYAHIYTDRPEFYFNKGLRVLGDEVWHSGNDGAGSGLDADLLDGLQASSFLRSDQDDTMGGQLIGGIGAKTTGGVTDWDDASNARSGNGYSLLLGTATNGPGGSGYYHPFSFEYSSKNGTGNMTQFAIPYNAVDGPYFRRRMNGVWSAWYELLHNGNPLAHDAVSQYCFAEQTSGATLNAGDTVAGSSLKPAGHSTNGSGTSLSGTWRCLGYAPNSYNTLFQRIA